MEKIDQSTLPCSMEAGASFNIPPWEGSEFHCSQLRRFSEEIRACSSISSLLVGLFPGSSVKSKVGGRDPPPETRDWKVRREGN